MSYYGTPYFQNGPTLYNSYSGQNAPYIYGDSPSASDPTPVRAQAAPHKRMARGRALEFKC